MAYEKVTAVNLTDSDKPEVFEILNLIAEEDNRSVRQVVEILIIRAGKDRAERIKERKDSWLDSRKNPKKIDRLKAEKETEE